MLTLEPLELKYHLALFLVLSLLAIIPIVWIASLLWRNRDLMFTRFGVQLKFIDTFFLRNARELSLLGLYMFAFAFVAIPIILKLLSLI